MGKFKNNPRCNVLSLRVSDRELEALEKESLHCKKSISELMREALHSIALLEESYHHSYPKGENRA